MKKRNIKSAVPLCLIRVDVELLGFQKVWHFAIYRRGACHSHKISAWSFLSRIRNVIRILLTPGLLIERFLSVHSRGLNIKQVAAVTEPHFWTFRSFRLAEVPPGVLRERINFLTSNSAVAGNAAGHIMSRGLRNFLPSPVTVSPSAYH